MTTEEILQSFFETETYTLDKSRIKTELRPERLRGEVLSEEIKVKNKVIVEAGKRVTARHVKLLRDSGEKEISFSNEYLLGKFTSKDIFDEETGEVTLACNSEIDEDVLSLLSEKNITTIDTLYINELEKGPYIANTLRIDPTSNRLEALVEIYRMMLSLIHI